MNFKYVDNHAHINFKAFDEDRDKVIKRAIDAEVIVINVGTQIDTSKSAIELAEKHEGMFAIIGLHPTHTGKSHYDENELGEEGKDFTEHGEEFDFEEYKKLAHHAKVVGIGECGLDYFHLGEESKEKQKKVFEDHIKLSVEVGKPLMLHIREAYNDAIEILKKYPGAKGNVHFFAGDIETTKQFLDLGFTLSFTGVVTFAKQYEELVKFIPLESILSETDCPYVSPKPYRGKRNEPSYVVEIVKKIAEIKNLPVEVVVNTLLENSKRVWKI